MPLTSCGKRASGFTLVEILVVVVILGILAAIVIPQFAAASDQSQKTTFVTNLRQFTTAAILFHQETGQYPEDASTGTIPTGLDAYLDADKWTQGPSLGGQWDAEYQDEGGITSALGVVFEGTGATRDDDYMRDIDRLIDDGDLATGGFRKISSNRYYSILAE